MVSLLRSIGLFVFASLAAPSFAQPLLELVGSSEGGEVIVQGRIDDANEPEPLFRAIWRGVPGGAAVFQLQRTSSSADRLPLMVDRLIEAGIGAYLDARVHFTKQGVKTDLPAERMAAEINAMMSATLEELGVAAAFSGLSQPTRAQLDRVTRIDWSQARFGIDGGEDQDKYLAIYYYVRSQREELERQIRADLLPLASVPVFSPALASAGTTVRINSTCGTVFDQENFLCALDLQLADNDGGGIDPALGKAMLQNMVERSQAEAASTEVPPFKIRKRDRWLKNEFDAINDRIDKLDQRKELWVLRDRMDDIEDRISGVELEVRDVRSGRGRSDNPLANLSDLTGRNITVFFERNSVTLEPDQRVLLNECFEQLARSSAEKVLITGYTDRSGDPAVNLRLSEQRARTVRNYLLERGINADRLLVNFYGDHRSTGRDPGERRVEIEWLR